MIIVILFTEIGEPGTMSLEELRKIVARDESYYPTHPDSDNPYRDGYFTEPPRKPRPSYLFYQGIYRSYFGRKYPDEPLPKIMTMLGDSWRDLSEEQQAPYVQLAAEETALYEKEKALLERAQRPTEMWQPIRRCEAVLNRLCDDPFASIFLEPVDTDLYTDYLEVVEFPMDLSTVRVKLKSVKNYMGPEVFARDVRKVRQLRIHEKPMLVLSGINQAFLTYLSANTLGVEQLQDIQSAWLSDLACGRLHVQAL